MFGKKFNQMRQWTGEKLGGTARTETSDDFRKLEQETEMRRDITERLYECCDVYLKYLGKRKENPIDKSKKMPLETLGLGMKTFGNMLQEESLYGKALVEFSSAVEKVANYQMELAGKMKEGYVASLSHVMVEMKDYQALKKKMENRRLDFDGKLNKVHKSKKENSELEEDTRVAQMKYEESMSDLTNKMVALNSNEDALLGDVLHLVEAEVEYYRKSADVLSHVLSLFADVPRTLSQHRAPVMSRSESFSSRFSSTQERLDHVSDLESSAGAASLSRRNPSNAASRDSISSDHRLKYASQTGAMVFPTTDGSAPTGPKRISSAPLISPRVSAAGKQVKALFDFNAEGPGELTLNKGDIVNVTVEIDAGWWEGEMADGSGRKGMFPSNYVEVTSSAPAMPPRPQQDEGSLSNSGRFGQGQLSMSRRSVSTGSTHDSKPAGLRPSEPASQRTSTVDYSYSGRPSNTRYESARPSEISTGPCCVCQCTDYKANAFKPGQCSNCYHKH